LDARMAVYGMWIRRRAPNIRKIAMSAVAELTAFGVWETWMPGQVEVSEFSTVRYFLGELEGWRLTSRWACSYINIVISSTIVTNIFQRLGKFCNQLLIERSRQLPTNQSSSSTSHSERWLTYRSWIITSIYGYYIAEANILTSSQKFCSSCTVELLRLPFCQFNLELSSESILQGDSKLTFKSAKLVHSSHSFLQWVIPPINKTPGFDISTEEAGELKVGDCSEELMDMLVLKFQKIKYSGRTFPENRKRRAEEMFLKRRNQPHHERLHRGVFPRSATDQ